VKPAKNFIDFLCFISLFPHLVAGPIMRYADLDRQLRERTHTIDKCMLGVVFLAAGFAKKLVLADTVAPIADHVFQHGSVDILTAWTGVVAYAMQIYFDFSAYSDMAFGLGLMIGFDLVQNFDSPYQAVSIQDFWRRWHISLSTWLRDYLYVPLGGNRRGELRTYVNLMTVMFLGGLWHGAAWTFVIWGLYHGILLAIERWLGDRNPVRALPKPAQQLITFLLVLVGWVFFRATDFSHAWQVLGSMIGLGNGSPIGSVVGKQLALAMFVCVGIAFFAPNLRRRTPPLSAPLAFACGLAISISIALMAARTASPFLYFQF
jgi:alginate O-acetyltransferase complex protein AlgI